MNIVDYVIVALFAFSILLGFYQGFISSGSNLIAFFVSLLGGKLFYGSLASSLVNNTGIVDTMLYYTDTAQSIGVTELINAPISALSADQVQSIVQQSNMPYPINQILTENITNQSLQGLTTLGEYFNYSVIYFVINVLSFVLLFLAIYIGISIILSLVNYTVRFPLLKYGDPVAGGVFGAVRGIFWCYIIFLLVPVVFAVLPADLLTPYLDESTFAHYFYTDSFILKWFHGFLG
ncbi:CvpA family protein [Gehongia tenuis]|uniref:CvpA family protein n=1 Tax=Gehongia tenuis TaxID=2763655 RepID=A0A926D6D7_9FIRM|nr:CvpA family protein [Gehongia tenuis]MBC8532091.1 CvpA family protein [Gehongia tenuis]